MIKWRLENIQKMEKNGRGGYKMDNLTFDFITGKIILLLKIVS